MPKQHTITLIPGDGIGPEVTNAVVRILEGAGAATGASFEWESYAAGADAFEKTRSTSRRSCIDSIERNRVALKGPVTTPIGGGFASINVTLRKKFELYANFRPIEPAGPETRYPGVDLVIVRENTEDLYVGLEHEVVPGVVESLKIITEKGFDAHRQIRLRLRAQAWPQEDPRHPQGEHHEDVRRTLPALRTRSGQGVSGDSLTPSTSSTTPACNW